MSYVNKPASQWTKEDVKQYVEDYEAHLFLMMEGE